MGERTSAIYQILNQLPVSGASLLRTQFSEESAASIRAPPVPVILAIVFGTRILLARRHSLQPGNKFVGIYNLGRMSDIASSGAFRSLAMTSNLGQSRREPRGSQ